MRRTFFRVPGFDCVRNPCGKRGCGTAPGAGHGIHSDEWVYVVSDGRTALALTVFSGVFPETVPAGTRAEMRRYQPTGADLTLHVGFPVRDGAEHECDLVAGGRCYQGGRYTTASGADDFFALHFRRDAGFCQPEPFWLALEQEHAGWAPDAYADSHTAGTPPAPHGG